MWVCGCVCEGGRWVWQAGGQGTGRGHGRALLVLLTVPLAWGTYTPAVKYMYDKVDPPMPGFVFSAGYYLVAATTLGALSSYFSSREEDRAVDDGGGGGSRREDDGDASTDGDGWDDGRIGKGGGGGTLDDDDNDGTITTRGGWELGSYLFVGNGLQVVGLQTVPADRAGE